MCRLMEISTSCPVAISRSGLMCHSNSYLYDNSLRGSRLYAKGTFGTTPKPLWALPLDPVHLHFLTLFYSFSSFDSLCERIED